MFLDMKNLTNTREIFKLHTINLMRLLYFEIKMLSK